VLFKEGKIRGTLEIKVLLFYSEILDLSFEDSEFLKLIFKRIFLFFSEIF
jgi:hypothetical protein